MNELQLFIAATLGFVLWKSECILFQLSHMNSEIGLNAQFHQMDQSCLPSASHPSLDALSGATRRQTHHQCQGQRDKVCFQRSLLKCRCVALSHGKLNIQNFLVLQEIKKSPTRILNCFFYTAVRLNVYIYQSEIIYQGKISERKIMLK